MAAQDALVEKRVTLMAMEMLAKLQREMKQIDDALKKVERERAEDTAWLTVLLIIMLDEKNDLSDELRNLVPALRPSSRQKPPTCDAQQHRRNSEMPHGRARRPHHRVLFSRQCLHRR